MNSNYVYAVKEILSYGYNMQLTNSESIKKFYNIGSKMQINGIQLHCIFLNVDVKIKRTGHSVFIL